MSCQGPYCSISALDRGDDYDEYGVCIAYVFAHPEGKSMSCNGRTFESGTIILAGEQLPTQAILKYCQPIIKKVRGWRETPIFARGDWWQNRKAPIALPEAICEFLDIIEHFTGTKIISIGNGPKGDEIVYIKRTSKGERQTSSKAKDKTEAKTKPKAKPKAKSKAAAIAEEKRIDSEDGGSYTLAEMKEFYRGKYKQAAIATYFEECKPVKKSKPKRK